MVERFDEIAADYDYWLDIDPDYAEHHHLVMGALRTELSQIDGREGARILEVGCGTGYTSRHILAVDARVRLCATDKSAEMLKIAAAQAWSLDWPSSGRRLMFRRIDVLCMTYEKVYRLVVSVFMLHNLAPDERCVAVANMARALEPGGLLIIGDKIALDDEKEHQEVMSRFWEVVERLKALGPQGRYDYWRKHNEEDELTKMTESELALHLEAAGLKDITIGARCGIGMYAIATARKPE